MTYRSRNSKLTKDGSEIIMESIKFRLQYDKSFLIHERYLPRKLKLYNNNSINNSISNVTSNHYANVFKYPREDSFSSKAHFNDSTNSFKFYKQPLAKLSPRKSNHLLQVNEDFYVPRKDTKFRSTEYLKDTSTPIELPLISDNVMHSKHYYQSMKKRTSKMRLRNLLDSGSELDLNTTNNADKLNAYVASENSQESAFYLSDKNYEKQLKQIDSYKEFKAKLGYSFSRRLPLASLQQPMSPHFMVLPISRHNPDLISGRSNINSQDLFKDANGPVNGQDAEFDDSELGKAVEVNSENGHVLDLEAQYNQKDGFESISLENSQFYDTDKNQTELTNVSESKLEEERASINENELHQDSENIQPEEDEINVQDSAIESESKSDEIDDHPEKTVLETNEVKDQEENDIQTNEADIPKETPIELKEDETDETILETNEENTPESNEVREKSFINKNDSTLSNKDRQETPKQPEKLLEEKPQELEETSQSQ